MTFFKDVFVADESNEKEAVYSVHARGDAGKRAPLIDNISIGQNVARLFFSIHRSRHVASGNLYNFVMKMRQDSSRSLAIDKVIRDLDAGPREVVRRQSNGIVASNYWRWIGKYRLAKIDENVWALKGSERGFGDFDATQSKVSLPSPYSAQHGCSNDQQKGKSGEVASVLREFFGIDGKLSSVFRELPIYLQLSIGISVGCFACVLYGFGFGFIDRRKRLLGGLFLLLGAVLFLGDGLMVTGFL